MDIKSTISFGISYDFSYDPNTVDYLLWLNCFEYVAEISQTQGKDMADLLLGFLKDSIITEISNRFFPFKPYECSYKELTNVLEKIYGKFKREHAMYYRFLFRMQFPYEPAKHYLYMLTRLLSKCKLKNEEFTDCLKKRFIEGLENEQTKAFLQQQPENMSIATALDIANMAESINKEPKILHI